MIVVADTSWVAALRDPEDEHHAAAKTNNETLSAEDRVMLAPLTLAECLVGPARLGVVQEAEVALRAAFEIAEEDDSAPFRWAVRRAETGLKLPDAIVLETAHRQGADAVATFDERLAAACRETGLAVLGAVS